MTYKIYFVVNPDKNCLYIQTPEIRDTLIFYTIASFRELDLGLPEWFVKSICQALEYRSMVELIPENQFSNYCDKYKVVHILELEG